MDYIVEISCAGHDFTYTAGELLTLADRNGEGVINPETAKDLLRARFIKPAEGTNHGKDQKTASTEVVTAEVETASFTPATAERTQSTSRTRAKRPKNVEKVSE